MNLNAPAIRQLIDLAEANQDVFIENGKKFWGMPELGYREVKTSKYATDCLESYGLKVKRGLSITGFRADLDTGRPGPTVALMGELDALHIPTHPEAVDGCVHACGHHTHINSLVGAAWLFTHCPGILDGLCGKIAFIGTPAEEGFEFELAQQLIAEGKIKAISGKISLYREGVLDDVDVAFMSHCGGKYGCSQNGGNVKKRVVFHGKSCHASAPSDGNNAMSQLTLAQCAIGLLRERMTSGMRIHGIITEGGQAANVIPDTAAMNYYVRGSSVKEMSKAAKMFDDAVIHSALALGGSAEVFNIQGSLPVRKNETLGNVHREVAKLLVPTMVDSDFNWFGRSAGCTDMGDITNIMPAIHGGVPGGKGTAHGIDFTTPDGYVAFVQASKHAAIMLYALLMDNAAEAKAAMAEFGPKLTHEQYEELVAEFK